MNYRTIRYILSRVLRIEAVTMLLPLICAFVYGESLNNILSWIASIALCIISSVLLSFKAPENKQMFARDGLVTVALSWILISVFGCLPFVFSGEIPSFIHALFETVSGFTTTGASILTDVEAMSHSFIFWRSFTHWIGGMGVLVFLVALLPMTGGSNFFLIKAESPGPSVSKLVPKAKSTAKILYSIYITMTVVLICLLWAGDMNFFEAIIHAFGTAGTGGFGLKNDSVASYSTFSQIVITVFMILFGVDFSLYHLIIMRKGRHVFKSDEFKAYLAIILVSITLICINIRPMFNTLSSCLVHGAFQVGSIITTTGFSTTDFDLWPEFSKTILVILMFVGACAGSTGGGIKVSRLLILFKGIAKEIKLIAHPHTTIKVKMNSRLVEHETVRGVNVFMIAYSLIFFGSVLLISIDNLDFTSNFTAVAATINNIGPGLSMVGPVQNFSVYSPFSLVVLTMDMLFGRLEIFPLLLLFSPYSWKD